ncbi:MAG: DUF6542 domain-containing protein, partial [Actinomycetes bacterium]
TSTGVAILGASVAVVASIIAELLTDGLGWLFAVPFVLVCVYCAAEVSRGAMHSAIVMPPLAILLVSAVNPIWSGNVPGPRGWMVKTLTTLTTLAPTLMVATALAAAIVGVRYWRANRL